MKKVLKKLGKYARKELVREEMYKALREVRKELIDGPHTQEGN